MFADEKSEVLRGHARCHGADVIDDEPGIEITPSSFCSQPTPLL